jgi:hypothetical protein
MHRQQHPTPRDGDALAIDQSMLASHLLNPNSLAREQASLTQGLTITHHPELIRLLKTGEALDSMLGVSKWNIFRASTNLMVVVFAASCGGDIVALGQLPLGKSKLRPDHQQLQQQHQKQSSLCTSLEAISPN